MPVTLRNISNCLVLFFLILISIISTVVFAVNTPPTRKLRCVKDGGGIYGVSCENEIFGTKIQIRYINLLLKSLNHGGGIYGVSKYDIQISLNHGGGIYDAGGIYDEYHGTDQH